MTEHLLGIYDPDKSNRTSILYEAIQPHVSDNTSILDIGCGTAPLARYTHEYHTDVDYFGFDSYGDIMKELAKQYPSYTFKRILYEEGDISFIKHKYNIIIHIGLDSREWTPIWGIHSAILKQPKLRPDHVLLETGYRPGYTGPYETYQRVQGVYEKHGYSTLDEGVFGFDVEGHHLKKRVWSVLEK